MAGYDSHIYVGTDGSSSGCEIWAYNGSDLEQVVGQGASGPTAPGFGNGNNSKVSGFIVLGSRLYAGIDNHSEGCGIWSVKSSTTWYLAEGATAGGYETWILVQNPNTEAVNIAIDYQTGEGPVQGPTDAIPPQSRQSYLVNEKVQTFEVSTRVTADADVICERAMYYTPPGYSYRSLGHDSIGVTEPGRTWYLAEGASDGGFETWILVQNPGADPVDVDIVYQTDSGPVQGPQETVPGETRRSYLVNRTVRTFNVSTKVMASGDVICERAVYWTPPGSAFKVLGHDSIGYDP